MLSKQFGLSFLWSRRLPHSFAKANSLRKANSIKGGKGNYLVFFLCSRLYYEERAYLTQKAWIFSSNKGC
jgi:hypothetical protein